MFIAPSETALRGPLRASRCIFRAHGCPCGYYTDPARQCRCTPYQIQRYIVGIFAMLPLLIPLLVLEHRMVDGNYTGVKLT